MFFPLPELLTAEVGFRTNDEVMPAIRAACAANADLATFHRLGESEEGRPLYGIVLGNGPQTVSLIAGAHADEPVGPETLRTLVLEGLRCRDEWEALWSTFRMVIVPHINPDGEARNRAWIEQWSSLDAYLQHVDRELPGRDLEFGFPSMRQENRLVAVFLRKHAPMHLHMSLHGMAFSEGAMLLIERHWAGECTQTLRNAFATDAEKAGLLLHDHNRKGEKGFFYIEPGFTTTPEGAAMRAHFQSLSDEDMAARFHDSSMEFVRSLGGDPLCLVTELPLFLIERRVPHEMGYPAAYLAFKEVLPECKLRAQQGKAMDALIEPFNVQAFDLRVAIRLQLTSMQLGLERVSS
ncbi:MAG TPA: M14 family zinc carboxypeptidase [Rhodothermales bacterium]|nr:M14 family zinc carboxypeptidase [Rhodothermales bacterium]